MKRWFQFSLRTWFVLLTIATCLFVFGRYAIHRQRLQRKIIETATLTYDGHSRHSSTRTVTSSALGTYTTTPRPYVWLRDSSVFPWASRASKGAVTFCAFDTVENHLNVPLWMRDILATGELRTLKPVSYTHLTLPTIYSV